MIVNRSTLTENDVDFINALIRKQPKIIVLRVIAVLLGLLWLTAAGLIGYSQLRYHDRSLSDMMLAAAFLIFALSLLNLSSPILSAQYLSTDPLTAERTCSENEAFQAHLRESFRGF